MAAFDQDKIFDAKAIRDTTNHLSIVSDNQSMPTKTIAVCNKLNQDVTCQLEGSFSASFAEVFNIGVTFVVTASTNDWEEASVYFPFIRVKATCSVAPTTGTLTIFLLKTG